ncbi:MAG: acyl-CoA dehydratase activase [Sphaerochaeta sp.]
MFTLGIDIGSTTSKCVILEDGKRIVTKNLISRGTGSDGPDLVVKQSLEDAKLSMDDISYIISTGYGRNNFAQADGNKSELSCHAKGVVFSDPATRTIIDIGGQDAKVIFLNDSGVINNFLMNDKCAAGTGRFLDVMSGILNININDLGDYAIKSKHPITISSTCTVFAESEVISQLSKGVDMYDLVAGICQSVASRTANLAKRGKISSKIYMSGGVALNKGVRKALSQELNEEINFNPDAQFMGALGASLIAYESLKKSLI